VAVFILIPRTTLIPSDKGAFRSPTRLLLILYVVPMIVDVISIPETVYVPLLLLLLMVRSKILFLDTLITAPGVSTPLLIRIPAMLTGASELN